MRVRASNHVPHPRNGDAASTAHGASSRHVMLLYAAEKDLPMNVLIDGRLRARFREQLGDGVQLYSEYIDVNRFPDKRYPRKLLEHLRDKYAASGLDLLIAVNALALDPVQQHRDWFFPTTPVVFCYVTEAEFRARTILSGVTGIPTKLAYGPTLELALKLHPRTRSVAVIAGASENDIKKLAEARSACGALQKVEFRYLVGLRMEDLRREVAQLAADTLILYLDIYQDGAGKFFIPRDALDQVAQAARVPIYSYYDSLLGHGIVGGYLASYEIEASNAARLGLKLLAGQKPDELAAKKTASCAYMFDWHQLQRWGIAEQSLPPDSVIHFRDAAEATASSLRLRYELLTARERAVFALVVAGKLNKQIAAELGAAERTVKAHRAQVMEKLQATSLAELVRLATQLPPGS